MAESVKTIIGVETMITAALIGEVRLNPLKSKHVKRHAKESRGNNSRKIS
jgi:hypothetical protein